MNKRTLGKTDLEITPLVFGGNVFGWTVNEQESFELLDQFLDLGGNCIDTANSYSSWVPGNSGGESETIIGNWLQSRKNREQVVLITKVGWHINDDRHGLTKKQILKEVEGSLKRLKTDYIDLYLSHRDDANTPVEETLEVYDQLIKEGKVRHIGASNFYRDRLEESIQTSQDKKLYQYKVVQPKLNLYDRGFLKGNALLAEKYDLGVITYSSLAGGFLSGKYKSEDDFNKSVRGQGMKQYLNDKGFRILEAMEEVSKRHNAPYAAIALAWLQAQPVVTAPIASATSSNQLRELMQSLSLQLSAEDLDALTGAGDEQQ